MSKTYPTLNLKEFDNWLNLVRGGHAQKKLEPRQAASSELSSGIMDLKRILAEIETDADKLQNTEKIGQFEIQAAGPVRVFIDSLDRGMKMDPGFWAYLGSELFEEINWRHSLTEPESKVSTSNFGSKAGQSDYFLLLRLYLRDRLSETSAHKAMGDQDLWNSHIIRVQTAKSKKVVSALLEKSEALGRSGAKIRSEAKTMKALRANIVTEMMDSGQSKDFVELAFSIT